MLVIWSHDTRLKTYPTSTGSASGLPDLRRTSRWSRLLKVTSLLFKFISRLQRREEDYEINYVMKTLQQEFIEELEFILDPLGGGSLPRLIHVLGLFLDWERLIRSSSRINRSLHFGYDDKNPVFLGKNHLISKLVMDCHSRCSHLRVGSTLAKLKWSGY